MQGRGTPTLMQYTRDLTFLAYEHKLEPCVGREQEIRRLIQTLSRKTKNNPCLIGERPRWARQPSWRGWPSGSWKEPYRTRYVENGL